MAVLLETTLGDVVIDLYTEERPRGETHVLRALAGRRECACVCMCARVSTTRFRCGPPRRTLACGGG